MRNPLARLFQGDSRKAVVRTPGKTISVSETGSSKMLSINGTIQSVVMKNSGYARDYWDMFPPLCYAFQKPRVFMIGLGGGTIAHQIGQRFGDNVSLDIAEVDEEVVRLSRRFFSLGQGYRILVGDGARILHERKAKYDIIMLDAYEGDTIPKQFLDAGFVRDAWVALGNRGVLAVNYISTMRYNGALEEYMRTLSKHFDVYEAREQRITWNSIIICAKNMGKDEIVDGVGSGLGYGNYEMHIRSAYRNMRRFIDEGAMNKS